jgi:hypothetical protein
MDDYGEQILRLLRQRGPHKTICPSEVLNASEKQNPVLMERVRASARGLAVAGKIEITQKGRVLDPANFQGPIRLRIRE